MICPFCKTLETKVIDSRLSNEGMVIKRRRACSQCGERFSTHEKAELDLPRVVKRDGQRCCFDATKLRAGMMRALEKRPVQAEKLESSILHILHLSRNTGEREVTSQWLGEQVMEQLRELDQVAYVRFASIYRSFQDIDAFEQTIKHLKIKEPADEPNA